MKLNFGLTAFLGLLRAHGPGMTWPWELPKPGSQIKMLKADVAASCRSLPRSPWLAGLFVPKNRACALSLRLFNYISSTQDVVMLPFSFCLSQLGDTPRLLPTWHKKWTDMAIYCLRRPIPNQYSLIQQQRRKHREMAESQRDETRGPALRLWAAG